MKLSRRQLIKLNIAPPPPPIELTQEPPPAPEVTPLAPVSGEIPQPILPSKPEPAKFSDELLAAVKNWSKVPKCLSCTKPVLANIDINLVAKHQVAKL